MEVHIVNKVIEIYAQTVAPRDYVSITEPVRARGLRSRSNSEKFHTEVFLDAKRRGKFTGNPGLLAKCFQKIPMSSEFNSDVRAGFMMTAIEEHLENLNNLPDTKPEEIELVSKSLQILREVVSK